MNVPKLRFKEFNDEWEEIKLKNIVNFSKGNILSKNDLDENGKFPCILYGQLYTKYKEVIREIFSRTNNDSSNIVKSKIGDVLIPSSGETPIDISTSSCLMLDNILVGGDINILSPKENCNGRFLSYMINNNKKIEIAKVAQGHSIVHLYNDNLKDIIIKMPSLKEQEQVANVLEILDKKIELQSKKIEALKLYKKGLIFRIIKEIKQTKMIKDICIYENGSGYENNVDENGNFYLISLNSINIDGNLKNNIKKVNLNNPKTLLKNDIVTVLSDVGHGDFLGISALIPEDNKYVLNQRMGLLRIIDNSNPVYIVNAINSIQKKFKKLGKGSSQLNLSKEDILNMYINYPDLKIQNYYGIIFNKLNLILKNNEEKLNKLESLKKDLCKVCLYKSFFYYNSSNPSSLRYTLSSLSTSAIFLSISLKSF